MHAQFLAISLPKETWNLPTSVSAALLPHRCSQHQWDLRSRLLRGWSLEKPPGLSPRDIKENQIMARPCFSSGPRLPAASRVNPVLLTFQTSQSVASDSLAARAVPAPHSPRPPRCSHLSQGLGASTSPKAFSRSAHDVSLSQTATSEGGFSVNPHPH